jgi:hypothetical protein
MAETPFSLPTLLKAFVELEKESEQLGEISTSGFIFAYRELYKLFDVLGRGFGFVKSDLVSKCDILEQILASDPEQFSTLEKMVNWEVVNDKTITNPKDNLSGSRTLLRLVRALDFILLFLQNLENKPNQALGTSCSEAYDKTLAHYHSWAIRKAAGVAFHLLPTRENFLHAMYPTTPSQQATLDDLHTLQKAVDTVNKKTQNLLASNNCDNLP